MSLCFYFVFIKDSLVWTISVFCFSFSHVGIDITLYASPLALNAHNYKTTYSVTDTITAQPKAHQQNETSDALTMGDNF